MDALSLLYFHRHMTDDQKAFRDFMDELIARFGSSLKLAKAIGIENTSVLRAAHETFTLNAENCLKLAEAAAENPSRVLRLAGKPDVAALIEKLYGGSREPISGVDRQLLALPTEAKRHLLELIQNVRTTNGKQAPHANPRKRTA